jgi:lysophospholipase L1-like esterase
MGQMFPRQAQFALLALLLAGLLATGLEGTARWYEGKHPSPEVDFSGGFSASGRVFMEVPASPGMFRTSELKKIAFVDQIFPRLKQPGALRIAVLGESSVNYLQGDLWALRPRLSAALNRPKIELINAGGKSYGSERLRLVARELLEFEPDVLVLYLGNNEFEEVEQLQLIRPRFASALDFFYGSAIVRVATGALFSAHLKELREAHSAKILADGPASAIAWTHTFSARDVSERMARFEANLRAMVELYRGRKTKLIMATIPSNVLHPELPLSAMPGYAKVLQAYSKGRFEEASHLGHELLRNTPGRHQSSDLENAIIRRVAGDNHLPLVDVERAVAAAEPHHVLGETLFKDHCHLNVAGNALLAGLLEKAIVQAASGMLK